MACCTSSRRFRVILLLLACACFVATGCSRTRYRLQADRDAHAVIAERNTDPRWNTADYGIEIDPRSRFFDPHDPDRSPMPPDDPASQRYMREVNGMAGWEHWDEHGVRPDLENPTWHASLNEYVETAEDGSVTLNIDSAVKLAYIHSPSHQDQLETLYLSALDVTAERFRLDTQFYGGYATAFSHTGTLAPASLAYDSVSGKYVVTAPADGIESNRLTVGNTSTGNPTLLVQRNLATAGKLLSGFANSFVFEFSGGDANLSASLANFAFIQPLLRGAGRDIALEQLTSVERGLLANLRAYGQFRQGFYTQVVIGETGVSGPQRGGRSTSVSVFSGLGGVGGYLGLLRDLQQIRNSEDNLSLQLRILGQLEALRAEGAIDLVQVDQFRQSVEAERDSLLQARNNLEFSLDAYKTGTLGLPPDLPVILDDTLIRQFQLIDREATKVQDAIIQMQDHVGLLPDDSPLEVIRPAMADALKLVQPFRDQLDQVHLDLERMIEMLPVRGRSLDATEMKQLELDRQQLTRTLADVETEFGEVRDELKTIRAGLTEQTRKTSVRKLVVWLGRFLRLTRRSVLVQARSRLESVTVEAIDMAPEAAFRAALKNRLDFMNARAALVDSWRSIQVAADALQSVLTVTANGEVRTARNNPASFRAATGNLQLGVEFDAPLTRLLERNQYREALINYQRSRRGMIRSRDSLHQGLRQLLRQIERQRTNLEIQRRAVAIAIRRVDLTRARLYAPVPPPQPGQRAAQFGPTAARNLLESLAALRSTQNNFMGVWLSYYAARMRLARELGTMFLDEQGHWIESAPQNPPEDDPDIETGRWRRRGPVIPAAASKWRLPTTARHRT